MLPLEGIRIIELSAYMNGPSAGYQLADLGADVVKIELPRRGDSSRGIESLFGTFMTVDGVNLMFDTLNRGKRSLTLDLRKQKGKEVLYRLVEKADVFFTNYRKDQVVELGVDYNTLSQYNPQLIYALGTAFGTRGPESHLRAYDPIIQGYSGLMMTMGEEGMPPIVVSGALMDQMGGTMLANSIVTALLVRERQGIGQEVEVSMLGGSIHLQYLNINTYFLKGRPMGRITRSLQRNPLTLNYQCSDGKWIILSELQSDRYWDQFCTAIGKEELKDDPRFDSAKKRRKTYLELISILEETFATQTRDEWFKIFSKKCPFAYGPIHTVEEAAESEQVKANEYVVEVGHPILGRIRRTGVPIRFSKTPGKPKAGAPELGQHTEEVLLEFGYSWDEISALREEKVI